MKARASIFLTDYASYNAGSQFEFGHWVCLDQFDTAQEVSDYITAHLAECDHKRPLDAYTTREEPMITDYEGFPDFFYSEAGMNFEKLFAFFEYFEDQNLDSYENEGANLLPLWNEYCSANKSDDHIYDFDNDAILMLCGSDPMEIFVSGTNADINWGHDYLYLDGSANICSTDDPSTQINEADLFVWINSNI